MPLQHNLLERARFAQEKNSQCVCPIGIIVGSVVGVVLTITVIATSLSWVYQKTERPKMKKPTDRTIFDD